MANLSPLNAKKRRLPHMFQSKKVGLLAKIILLILLAYMIFTLVSVRQKIADANAAVETLTQQVSDQTQTNTELSNAIENRDDPSYVEDILGPCLFDFGYGPFRWCCLSRNPEDLDKTDAAAAEYILAHNRRYQDYDNYVWVRDAKKNKLVVGTQCRILYQDAMGRMNLALKFNEMVRNGEIGPVILGRDHHDTGGTDAPFRETSNIKDGSNIMAEMATQCYAGNAARGMSYIALHNGGGTGIGRAINGGFGMVLDGSERVDTILRMSMPWDTMVGVARRSWARNENAMTTVAEYNKMYEGQDHITMPYVADEELCEKAVKEYMH